MQECQLKVLEVTFLIQKTMKEDNHQILLETMKHLKEEWQQKRLIILEEDQLLMNNLNPKILYSRANTSVGILSKLRLYN